jgi:hypothetical protein
LMMNWRHLFHKKKWRPDTLQPGLEFDNFKPRIKSGMFKCISWLYSSFLGAMIGVLWKWESEPIYWYQFCPSTRQHFSCLHTIVYEFISMVLNKGLWVCTEWYELSSRRLLD